LDSLLDRLGGLYSLLRCSLWNDFDLENMVMEFLIGNHQFDVVLVSILDSVLWLNSILGGRSDCNIKAVRIPWDSIDLFEGFVVLVGEDDSWCIDVGINLDEGVEFSSVNVEVHLLDQTLS